MKYLLIASLLLTSFLPVQAQNGQHFSLKSALEESSQNNLFLDAQKRELQVLEGRTVQAQSIPNPDVEGSIDEIATGSSETGDAVKQIGVQQTLEIWGKRARRVEAAQVELEAARLQYNILELDVSREVKETYWNLSYSEDQINFANENLKFQQRFLARVQERFQSGQSKISDVARMKLEVARASNDLLTAEKNYKEIGANLNRLMGRDIRKKLLATEHLMESLLEVNEDSLIQEALSIRPELKANALLRKGAVAEKALAKRLLWAPDLKAGLVWQSNARDDGRNSWGGQLGMSVPLWYRYKGEQLSAEGKEDFYRVQEKSLEQIVTLEVHQAFLDLGLSGEQVKVWKQAVDQATESNRLAYQQVLEGDADLLVYIQTRRDLVSATLDYLGSLRNYKTNLAALDRSVGKNLTEEK